MRCDIIYATVSKIDRMRGKEHFMKRILSGILCLLMVLMLTPALMRTADAATSGKCGKNLTWSYDRKTATLTIKGSGKMYDYRECGPWREHNIICEVKLCCHYPYRPVGPPWQPAGQTPWCLIRLR